MKFEKIQGLIAATFSPFNPQGELNTTVIPEYANFLYKNGNKGVFINGTTGEGASLTFDEKQILMTEWARYNAPDFKVIAMVAGTSQKEGIALTKLAGETGIYGISVNAPYYVKTGTVTDLIDFMEPIAAAAPELAFYFYHIPLLSGVYLPMQELLEQAGRRIPNFAGIKYTHNDLMEFNLCLRYDNYRYDILWGWDEMLLAGLSMGAKGGVGSTYNFAAPLYLELINRFETKDLERALHLQEKSIDLISLYPRYGGAATGKTILKIAGIDCGDFRPPGKILSDNQRKELWTDLQKQSFFNYSAKS